MGKPLVAPKFPQTGVDSEYHPFCKFSLTDFLLFWIVRLHFSLLTFIGVKKSPKRTSIIPLN